MFFKKQFNQVNEAGNDYKTFPRITYLFLVVTGICGLYIYSLLASVIINSANIGGEYLSSSVLFLTYSFLAITLIAIIGNKISTFVKSFINLKSYVFGIIFGIALIVIPMIYSSIVNLFYQSNINSNEQGLRSTIMVYPGLSILFLGIIGPICEEIIYRLGIFESINKPKWIAYLVSIVIFAFMHFDGSSSDITNELINLPSYLLSGAILALAYDKFNIATSLTAHMINNLFSVVMFILSQMI